MHPTQEAVLLGRVPGDTWFYRIKEPGDQVKVKYHPVRDGKPAGYMMSVMSADGRYVGRAPQSEAPPPPEKSLSEELLEDESLSLLLELEDTLHDELLSRTKTFFPFRVT